MCVNSYLLLLVVVPKCVSPTFSGIRRVSDDVGAFEVGFKMKAGLHEQQALHVQNGTSSTLLEKAKRTPLATVWKHMFQIQIESLTGTAVFFVSKTGTKQEIAFSSIISELHFISQADIMLH